METIDFTGSPPPRMEEACDHPTSPPGRILQAAEDLFSARGFDGTTTRDIAARAGVNIATIHYYWGSKEDLWYAVIYGVIRNMISLTSDLAQDPPDDPVDGIREFVGRAVDLFADNPNYARLLQYRTLRGVSQETAREIAYPILVIGLKFMEKYQNAGHTPPFDPAMMLFSFQGALRIFFQETDSVKAIFGEEAGRFSPKFRQRLKDYLSSLALCLMGMDPPDRNS